MDTLTMTIELTLNEYMPYSEADPDEREWMEGTIFKENLIVHSNEIGDQIGTMKIIDIKKPLEDDATRG